MNYSDVPSHDSFGLAKDVIYSAKEFVGYRYYATYGVKPSYPFGYGLSYCQFILDDAKFERMKEYDFEISCNVTNSSAQFGGKETVLRRYKG